MDSDALAAVGSVVSGFGDDYCRKGTGQDLG